MEVDRPVGGEEQHPHLAAVAGVDQARRVDQRDAVLERQARTRQDQTADPVGNLHGEPGADADPRPGREAGKLGRAEVESRIVVVGPGGQRGLLVELDELQVRGLLGPGPLLCKGNRDGPAVGPRLRLRRRERLARTALRVR